MIREQIFSKKVETQRAYWPKSPIDNFVLEPELPYVLAEFPQLELKRDEDMLRSCVKTARSLKGLYKETEIEKAKVNKRKPTDHFYQQPGH